MGSYDVTQRHEQRCTACAARLVQRFEEVASSNFVVSLLRLICVMCP